MKTEQEDSYPQVREVSPETNPGGTLIMDFQSPELWENKYLLFKSPSVWFCCDSPSRLIHKVKQMFVFDPTFL